MFDISIIDVALYLGTGAVVGLLSGMLGVGGGLVVVPTLLYLLPLSGVPHELVSHMAVATSLATIVVTSSSSVRAHHKHGSIIWPVFRAMTPGVIGGGIIGAATARFMPSMGLKSLFGVFALLIAVQMIFKFRPAPHQNQPGRAGLLLAGTIIGGFSTLVGIGGGSVTVPFLSYWDTPMARAVGTAAAISLPLSIAGTVGFVVGGWNVAHLPPLSLGFVFIPAFLGIVLVSSLTAPVGAKLAQRLPGKFLSRVFAGFLIAVGLDILLHLHG